MVIVELDFSSISKFKAEIERLNGAEKSLLIKRILSKVSSDFLGRVKRYSPYLSGNLNRKWFIGKLENNTGIYERRVYNTAKSEKGAPYPVYVNDGHKQTPGRYVPAIGKRLRRSRIPGQKFLEKALAETESVSKGIMKGEVELYFGGLNVK